MKNLTLNLTGYTIKGIADVTLWGGDSACIKMTPFNVDSIKEIPEKLNDGGFGVEEINGAVVDVYRNYEGTEVFSRSLTINEVSESTMNYFYEDF